MPIPSTPTLSLSAPTANSFQATITSDVGVTNSLYYRQVGGLVDVTGPSLVGSGSVTVSNLVTNGQYQAWVISSNGSSYSLPALAFVSLAQTGDLLSTAIQQKFSSSAPLASLLSGGLWTGEVPEGTAPPYGWLDIRQVSSVPNFEDQWEVGRVTVNLYAVGAASAENLALQWKATFDYKPLPFATAQFVQYLPLNHKLVCEMMRYKDSTLMYRSVLAAQIISQKVR